MYHTRSTGQSLYQIKASRSNRVILDRPVKSCTKIQTNRPEYVQLFSQSPRPTGPTSFYLGRFVVPLQANRSDTISTSQTNRSPTLDLVVFTSPTRPTGQNLYQIGPTGWTTCPRPTGQILYQIRPTGRTSCFHPRPTGQIL